MSRQQGDERSFWWQKIVQFLHDPPGKPYFFRPHSGGHSRLAWEIMKTILPENRKPSRYRPPDLIATGADRPMLTLKWGEEGGLGIQYFHKDPTITHPLERAPLTLRHPHHAEEISREHIDDIFEAQIGAAKEFAIPKNADTGELKKIYFELWRRLCSEVIARQEGSGSLWQFMPADSRCPDHSIWDHNRMTSALAFVHHKLEPGQEEDSACPWLFSFALRPVQEFLAQARKSQDLWVGSMLLSELSLAAMEPIIEQYGPDTIVYPDLRGNPRFDIWLDEHYRSALPDEEQQHTWGTRAALLPHTFVAVLPRGNSDYLRSVEKIGRECRERVDEKWQELAGHVQGWMESVVDKTTVDTGKGSGWARLWEHARGCPLEPTWVAQPWPVLEPQQGYAVAGHGLPAQKKGKIPTLSVEDKAIRERRFLQLGQWLDPVARERYEFSLSVYARTNQSLLSHSGFLYAQAHHKLKVRHGLRRRLMTLPQAPPAELALEKCPVCHFRPALGNESANGGHCESIRQQVRQLWQNNRELDPEQQGSERLCPVCSLRRFLVRSDSTATGKKPNSFNRVWAGPNTLLDELRDRDGKVRTPFPSTVQIAAQEYLVRLAGMSSSLESELKEIIRLHRQLDLGQTSFARAMPRLAEAAMTSDTARQFLMLDTQLALFPEMVLAKYQTEDDSKQKEQWEELAKAVSGLRVKADSLLGGAPETHMAVVTMDGDKMGELLLGHPDRIRARWKDVLHPAVDKKVKKRLVDQGWGDLRLLQRQAGPFLHAFISRALADFNHHIVPWVVEQEFSGRLIYCGGDDVLALAPVAEALPMADKLRTLFSAPWLVDTIPGTVAWSWLPSTQSGSVPFWNPQEAKKRFRIITGSTAKEQAKSLLDQGRLIPMLGTSGSLSAGIAYGHFKTRMGLLLQTSHELLDDWAKDRSHRNSAGLGHFSRSGIKTMFAGRWDGGTPQGVLSKAGSSASLRDAVDTVVKGYLENRIPSSLPYKLSDSLRLFDPAEVVQTPEEQKPLLEGLLVRAVDGPIPLKLKEAVLALWQAGYRLEARSTALCEADSREEQKERIQPLAGLFLCRYLAGRRETSQQPDEQKEQRKQ